MRFKTDENLPIEVAERLRQHQHDALSVPEQQLAGQADPLVAQVCQSENRALITCDLDFSDIRAYPPEDYPGIIVLRPAVQTVSSLLGLVTRILPLLDQEPLGGHIWIVDDHRVRIRGKGPQSTP
jgi:predicted nuclease of predicted toxin-antitoxin system